jgi:hypothetical protein
MPDEPVWYRKLCRAGHPLRIHGRPRTDKPNIARCRRCVLEYRRTRRALAREAMERPAPAPLRDRITEIDQVSVDRMVAGQRHGAVVQGVEVFEAVRTLTERGWSIRLTAQRVQVSERTVARIRRKIRKGLTYGQAS